MDAKAIYLKDAFSFLESLPEKAQRKVFYNIDMICGGVKDEKLFKKLEGSEIWEVRTFTTARLTDCSHFGTPTRKRSLWPQTDLSRKP